MLGDMLQRLKPRSIAGVLVFASIGMIIVGTLINVGILNFWRDMVLLSFMLALVMAQLASWIIKQSKND